MDLQKISLKDLDFSYPEDLVATQPVTPSRIMQVAGCGEPQELKKKQLLELFQPGDVLVVNNSQVVKRRVFLGNGIEVLFLKEVQGEDNVWEVLMPARKLKGSSFELPGGLRAELIFRARPQKIKVDQKLNEDYFIENAELPLPPYIQKSRGERKPVKEDGDWYQTDWAEKPGSLAAPTASFHFKKEDLQSLEEKGVQVCHVTLHVGLGTFLPIVHEDLSEHEMHSEWVSVSSSTWQSVQKAKEERKKVWALGSTVTRSLESVARGMLKEKEGGSYVGPTQLFLQPGDEFMVVDCLLTNFHQPKTTLVAMVMAFAGVEKVKSCYQWAIDQKFRLFSYGDLSLWMK